MEMITTNNIEVTQNIVTVPANHIIVQQIAPQPVQTTKFITTSLNVNQTTVVGAPAAIQPQPAAVVQTTPQPQPVSTNKNAETGPVLPVSHFNELVREIDPNLNLEEDVEETLINLAEDFINTIVNGACLLAKHRHVSTIEVKDLLMYLDRNYNMWIPGFGTDELRPYKRSSLTESHKQRLALIRKTLKKY